MSTAWSDSDWKNRLKNNLEPLLKSPNLAAEISRYEGVPFALFAYPPTAERALRTEVKMLKTRVEAETGRTVTVVSMSELVQQALEAAFEGAGVQAAYDGERFHARKSTEERLEMLQGQMERILDEIYPIPEAIKQLAEGLDPKKNILFLTRVGRLYPFYRASTLLENLMDKVVVPTILFYPGTRGAGRNTLRFMDSLESIHSYRHRIL